MTSWDGLAAVLADICEREGWTFHGPDLNAVVAFEHASGVMVPEPYRSFVCEVSSGIETDCMQLARFATEELALPAAPFPYDRDYGDRIITALAAGRSLTELGADPAFAVRQHRGVPPGCLVIGELDGALSVLALNGEELGSVWLVGDFDLPETRHKHTGDGDSMRLDFARWLDCWAAENGLTKELAEILR